MYYAAKRWLFDRDRLCRYLMKIIKSRFSQVRTSRFAHNTGMDARLFPPITPWRSGWLEVDSRHRVYFEQCGHPGGVPMLVFHGGPGSGASPMLRRLLDPACFNMVLFDQRGCGRSTPRGELRGNHSEALIGDIEKLRAQLDLGPCAVLAGSWGAALALAWAGRYPGACLGALLRAPFLTGKENVARFFDEEIRGIPSSPLSGLAAAAGAPAVFPWLPRAVLDASTLESVRPLLAAWMFREQVLASCGRRRPDLPPENDELAWSSLWDKYRVQAHYLLNDCFLGEQAILEAAVSLSDKPVFILHGRADLVCRPGNARKLAACLPAAHVIMIDGAGHDPFAPAMLAATQRAATRLSQALCSDGVRQSD